LGAHPLPNEVLAKALERGRFYTVARSGSPSCDNLAQVDAAPITSLVSGERCESVFHLLRRIVVTG
jgi:hypothetical protein